MEGDIPPTDPGHQVAIKAWNLLTNGMGGIDWSGLPYVCALLGIEDVEQLIERLLVIKTHKPDKDE